MTEARKTFGDSTCTPWQLTNVSSTVYERFRWEYDEVADDGTYLWEKYQWRERTTRTYTRLVGQDFEIPSSPVNPDGLAWTCINRELDRGYGERVGTYSETYELLGSWNDYNDQSNNQE